MFDFIKRLIRRPKRKSILNDIKKAKRAYLSETSCCMCSCFFSVDEVRYSNYREIQKRIPEFKPETFNVDPELLHDFWWRLSDRDSRIKAFDKLIKIYE